MSAEPIVLLGGGGHALDVANAIERSLGWDSIAGYLDDQPSDRMAGWDIPHLGELSAAEISGKRIVLAIGFPAARQAVLQKFDVAGLRERHGGGPGLHRGPERLDRSRFARARRGPAVVERRRAA